MPYQNLIFERNAGVAVITLNRPQSFNAMTLELTRELSEIAMECDTNDDIRAVIVTGAGKAFSAGGDLASFKDAGPRVPYLLKEMTTHLHAAISRFSRMSAPLIASVNGMAAGAGMSLACAADITLAARSAKFTMAYTAVGLAPDGSSTFYLPRIIGMKRTKELMLTNRTLTAEEAADWGLVNSVVDDDALMAETMALASKLAAGPTAAYGAIKRMLAGSSSESLEGQLELESRAISDAARTEDHQEGRAAFFEKRKPQFKGN